MSYKEKDLVEEFTPRVRWSNGQNVNLVTVRNGLQNQADANGIPVAFEEEQIKVGGLFSSEREDILIMYNPQHPKDYLRFAIRLMHQGTYAFMYTYIVGYSKNFSHEGLANVGGAIGGFQKLANKIGGLNKKVQEEENYYTILRDCLANVTGV